MELRKIGDSGFKIKWSDGHESQYGAITLRGDCPCAACVNELTGERTVVIEDIAKDLAILKANLVGNYAVGFGFSDGHSTGLYSFDHLRKMCPCCAAVKA